MKRKLFVAFRSAGHEVSEQVDTEKFKYLRLITTKAKVIDIELFEREDGMVMIRGINCGLIVHPRVTNGIAVSGE